MINVLLFITVMICAIQSIRSRTLILSTIWLAGLSALLSICFFLMGAHQVAVIEISVGAGLVTVLLVFAIGVAGEEAIEAPPLLPKFFALGLVLALVLLLGLRSFPQNLAKSPIDDASLSMVLWEDRGLDVLTQIVLIFAGVLGLLGLLAEAKPPLEAPMADEYIAIREDDLAVLEKESAESAQRLKMS